MQNTKRGRPQKNFQWPQGDFTVKEIESQTPEKLSGGLIHMRIKEALSSGEIQLVGKKVTASKGRPKNVYRKIK